MNQLRQRRNVTDPRASVAVEAYLAAIYEMAAEDVPTIGTRVAAWLGVTPPTVNGTARRMERDGLLTFNSRKELVLTELGDEMAAAIVRRHRLAERFLVDVLGLNWHQAHTEASRWEHAISPEVEERLTRFMAGPTTCPHGNPIPGSGYVRPADVRCLSDTADGDQVVVERVFEEIELQSDVLEFLDTSGIKPGARLIVTQVAPAIGTVTVLSGGDKVALGLQIAQKIWVRPAPVVAA